MILPLIFLIFFSNAFPKPLSPMDVLLVRDISQLALSGDGKKLLFVLREASLERNSFAKYVYLWDGSLKRLGEGYSPSWSPKGRYAYASGSLVVTSSWSFRLPGRVLKISFMDGDRIIALVKQGSFRDLFLVDLSKKGFRRLTRGFYIDSFSSASGRIVFASRAGPSPQDVFLSRIYLYENGEIIPLTGKGYNTLPLISPDGKKVAYISRDGFKDWLSNMHVKLIDINRRTQKSFKSLDRHVFILYRWHGPYLYLLAGDSFYYYLYSLDVRDGSFKRLMKGRFFSFSRDMKTWAFVKEDLSTPPEVFLKKGSRVIPITGVNKDVRLRDMGKVKRVSWRVGGFKIEGLLVESVGKPIGTLILLHGGPSSCFKERFSAVRAYLPSQVFAGAGFRVFMPNPRGSSGYGELFRRALSRLWGVADVEDVLAGIKNLGLPPGEKLYAAGWSYGGYLALMLASRLGKLRKIIVGGAIGDLYSLYGTTDVPDWMLSFFKKTPYQDPWIYLSLSPTYHARRIKVDTLILHGTGDRRVPFSQAMEIKRALESFGVRVKLVPFKGEGHVFSKPLSRLKCIREELCFLEGR